MAIQQFDRLETYEDGYSSLTLGIPGGATVHVTDEARISFSGGNEIDEQGASGKNLGRPKHKRLKLTEVNISWVVLAGEDETNFWNKVFPVLREKSKRGQAQPIDLLNSQCFRANIRTVIVADYNIGEPNPRDGREVTVKCKEWAPKPVEQKPVDNSKVQFGPPTLEQFTAENANINVF